MARLDIWLALVLTTSSCTLLLDIDGDFSEAPPPAGGSGAEGGQGAAHDGGGGQGLGGEGGAGGAGGEGAMGPITGHLVSLQIDPLDPNDISDHRDTDFAARGLVIEALVLQGDEWQTYPGVPDGLSHFRIEGVPPGPYLLHVDYAWHWMINRDDIDLDSYQIEAFDIESLSPENDPPIHLVVSNMSPWNVEDNLQFFVPTKNVGGFLTDASNLTPPFTPGMTAVDATGRYLEASYYIDTIVSAGDPAVFLHMGVQGTDPYVSLLDFTELSYSMSDNNDPVEIAASFTPFNPDGDSFELNVDVAAFEAMATDMNPRADHQSSGFTYGVIPQPYSVWRLSGSADLVSHIFPPGETSTSHLTYYFGNPFDPERWNPFIIINTVPTISYQLPGLAPKVLTTLYYLNACEMAPDDPLLPSPSAPLEPIMVPPTGIAVDGIDFFSPGVSPIATAAPTISWTPPPGVTVSRWTIRAREVNDNGNGGTSVSGVLPSMTTGGDATSIALPPGYLKADQHYVFFLTGMVCPDCDYEQRPGRPVLGYCQSSAMSEIFLTPPG